MLNFDPLQRVNIYRGQTVPTARGFQCEISKEMQICFQITQNNMGIDKISPKFIIYNNNNIWCQLQARCWFQHPRSYHHIRYQWCMYTVAPQLVRAPRNEYLFILKNKVRLSKIELFDFCFFSKKSVKMTLNGVETSKNCKN